MAGAASDASRLHDPGAGGADADRLHDRGAAGSDADWPHHPAAVRSDAPPAHLRSLRVCWRHRARAVFERPWLRAATWVLGALYGYGALVHLMNLGGWGERPWSESPLSWKVGDLAWGTLDLVALVGIVGKSAVGLAAVAAAALSQVVAYGWFPEAFALHARHFAVLRSMVYFNALVLVALGVLLWAAGREPTTSSVQGESR